MKTDNDDISVGYYGADRFINPIIRAAILMRGSRKLFGSEQNSKEYLASLYQKQKPFCFDYNFKSETSYINVCEMNCAVLTNKDKDCKKVIIYLPGGAFAREATSLHFKLADNICTKTGAKVILCAYPKAPTSKAQRTYELLLSLYRRLLYDYSPNKIIISGDSSGGAIAISFMQWLKNEGLPKPALLLLYSPLLDCTLSNPDLQLLGKKDPMLALGGLKLFVDSWQGDISVDSVLTNPFKADFSLLPQTVIFCGTNDLLCCDAKKYVKKAPEKAKINLFTYKNMYHCFILYPLKAAKDALNKSAEYINKL